MEKIDHFSHEEHPLILKELKAAGDSAAAAANVVCYGCQQPILIGTTTYCCIKCDDVFLHKSCAELPLQITHPMHSQHPLQLLEKPPYLKETCGCDICRRSWEYFTYHCSKCNFDVDVICAKLEIFKHTIDGKHPLILVKELQPDMMMMMVTNSSEKATVCYICEEEILISARSSSSTYFCSICEVFTHKSCGELPYEIMHPMHNSACHHMLKLSARLGGDLTCNICNRRSVKNCAGYLCSKCEFVVDDNCAKLEIFKHTIDGKHPLILVKELQPEMMMMVMSSSNEKVIVCCNCEEELLISAGSSSSTYFCSICQVFVHKSCGELPSEIMHPMHNSACHHPLQLFLSNREYSTTCVMCDKPFKGTPAYCCHRCEFYLDVLCGQDDGKILQHPGHKHPLKLQQKSALFKCHACGVRDEDESYDCTACSFWIHKSCGSLPNDSYKCPAPHLETLAIAFCFPEKDRPYENLKCDICKEEFYPYYWLLYCGPCRYYVHIKCIKSKSPENEAAKANSAGEIPPNWISLPADVVSLQLIQHYLKENGLPAVLIEQSTKIDHFSHRHPLTLTNIQDDYSEMDDDDQETVCNGCVEPISGSCYACAPCNYFLHLHCAQLPNNLSSSYHPQHQLSLNHCHQEFDDFYCRCCDRNFNGFFYECKGKNCGLKLDINCALLPSATKHEAHDHFLFRDDHSNKFCNACNTYRTCVFFSCKTCGVYNLCIDCTTLPRTIRHRWDKHPLTLSFPPFYYHPAEFICDICEEEAHPKYWLYHCRECDNSFHLRCIRKRRKKKYGGKLQIDDEYHPHPLTFLREVKYKLCCDECGQNFEGDDSFGCEDCYLYLCLWCAMEIVHTGPKEYYWR